jgi:hypothetical protein
MYWRTQYSDSFSKAGFRDSDEVVWGKTALRKLLTEKNVAM